MDREASRSSAATGATTNGRVTAREGRCGSLLGGLGVSGDTSCSDHIIAWKLRHALNLDNVPAGPDSDSNTDNIIFTDGTLDGFEHPSCFDTPDQGDHVAIADALPDTHPVGADE